MTSSGPDATDTDIEVVTAPDTESTDT